MDFISQSVTWPTTTEQTWIEEAERLKDIFFKNASLSELKLVLPLGYRLFITPKSSMAGPWMSTASMARTKKSQTTKKNDLNLANSFFGITIRRDGGLIDKTSECHYMLGRVNEIKKDLQNVYKQVAKVDFMEMEFHQNETEMAICFTQKLPPVSFKGELSADLASMDIPIEYQIQSDSVIIKYYFADFNKIRDRLNDFIRACSVFYTVYCRQPSLTEREDLKLEVKWS